MKTLEDLLAMGREHDREHGIDTGRVWVHVGNEEEQAQFTRRAIEEGFTWSGGRAIDPEVRYPVAAIHENRTVAYLPLFVWMFCMGDDRSPLCIDYPAVRQEQEDVVCREKKFTMGGMTSGPKEVYGKQHKD